MLKPNDSKSKQVLVSLRKACTEEDWLLLDSKLKPSDRLTYSTCLVKRESNIGSFRIHRWQWHSHWTIWNSKSSSNKLNPWWHWRLKVTRWRLRKWRVRIRRRREAALNHRRASSQLQANHIKTPHPFLLHSHTNPWKRQQVWNRSYQIHRCWNQSSQTR